jgi:hypothetical protein
MSNIERRLSQAAEYRFGSFTPIEQRRPPAALLPIAALRASMAAVRYAPAARLHRLNFRDRPVPDTQHRRAVFSGADVHAPNPARFTRFS